MSSKAKKYTAEQAEGTRPLLELYLAAPEDTSQEEKLLYVSKGLYARGFVPEDARQEIQQLKNLLETREKEIIDLCNEKEYYRQQVNDREDRAKENALLKEELRKANEKLDETGYVVERLKLENTGLIEENASYFEDLEELERKMQQLEQQHEQLVQRWEEEEGGAQAGGGEDDDTEQDDSGEPSMMRADSDDEEPPVAAPNAMFGGLAAYIIFPLVFLLTTLQQQPPPHHQQQQETGQPPLAHSTAAASTTTKKRPRVDE